jgi:NAD(P)-dependent dehydrogenase (short-subunit alcohol dehydrogenase family)
MRPIAGSRVVITGAAQGLGAALARAFADAGARLVLLDRDAAGLNALVAETGGTAIPVDLADADATQAAIAAMLAEDAQIDTLIHNAAILVPQPLAALEFPMFRATLDVGIQAGYLLARAALPWMQTNGGAMIFVSSQSGIKGFADETAYCAAKHALEGFSKSVALEEPGLVSCTITPGKAMHTPMSERNYPPEMKAQWVPPARLAPAFLHIAETRDPAFSGQRLNAWDIAQTLTGAADA